MPEGEEWYLGPIAAGYYRYPDLLDGTLSIEHIAECNDAMAYEAENRARIQEAMRPK